jgi:hypothetical protein
MRRVRALAVIELNYPPFRRCSLLGRVRQAPPGGRCISGSCKLAHGKPSSLRCPRHRRKTSGREPPNLWRFCHKSPLKYGQKNVDGALLIARRRRFAKRTQRYAVYSLSLRSNGGVSRTSQIPSRIPLTRFALTGTAGGNRKLSMMNSIWRPLTSRNLAPSHSGRASNYQPLVKPLRKTGLRPLSPSFGREGFLKKRCKGLALRSDQPGTARPPSCEQASSRRQPCGLVKIDLKLRLRHRSGGVATGE